MCSGETPSKPPVEESGGGNQNGSQAPHFSFFCFFYIKLHPRQYHSVGGLCAKIRDLAMCDLEGIDTKGDSCTSSVRTIQCGIRIALRFDHLTRPKRGSRSRGLI